MRSLFKKIENSTEFFSLNFIVLILFLSTILLSIGCKNKEKEIKEQSIRSLELNSNEIVADGQDMILSKEINETDLELNNKSLPTNTIDNLGKKLNLEQKLKFADTLKEKLSLFALKKYYNRGNYRKVVNADVDENEYAKKYYQAISYYCLLQTPLPTAEKNDFITKAKKSFKEIGIKANNATQQDLKTKAILWHGIMMMQYPQKEKLVEIIKPFKYIEKNYSRSKVYDDALFYLARFYQLKGNDKSAQQTYAKLNKVNNKKNKIYDIWYKKFVEPQKAIAFYNKNKKNKSKNKKVSATKTKNSTKPTPLFKSKLNSAKQSKDVVDNLDKAYKMIVDGKIPKNVKDTLYYEDDGSDVILETSEAFNEDEELRRILETEEF